MYKVKDYLVWKCLCWDMSVLGAVTKGWGLCVPIPHLSIGSAWLFMNIQQSSKVAVAEMSHSLLFWFIYSQWTKQMHWCLWERHPLSRPKLWPFKKNGKQPVWDFFIYRPSLAGALSSVIFWEKIHGSQMVSSSHHRWTAAHDTHFLSAYLMSK